MQKDNRKEDMLGLVARADLVYLGTVCNGAPRIKVVTKHIYSGLRQFYFVTLTHRHRTLDIQKDGRACLYFAEPQKLAALRLDGTATVTRDPEILRRLWEDGLRIFFKSGAADSEFSAIEFRTDGGNFHQWPYIGDFQLFGEDVVWKDWVKQDDKGGE